MVDSAYAVGIVVDPDFGERLRTVAERIHTWVVDSPTNRAVAETIWRVMPSHDLERGVTAFRVDPHQTRAEWCLDILPVVVEHHGQFSHEPPVSVLEIHGTERTPKLAERLAALGFEDIETTATGLMAGLRRDR